MAKEKLTIDRVDEMMREVFRELDAQGARARGRDVSQAIEPRLNLTDYEKGKTGTGSVRWETTLRFYTTHCVRAGYIQKSNGYWTLTHNGRDALELRTGRLVWNAQKTYRNWLKEQPAAADAADVSEEVEEKFEAGRQTVYDRALEDSQSEIENHLQSLGPYEFQKLVAELLRGMGYYVPYVAPPGPDGGIDLIAYRDPLGTSTPRIRCQIKHRQNKMTANEVRELEGVIRTDGDTGLVVSSNGFTTEATREVRSSRVHIEMMDIERIIDLWQDHYNHVSETGRALLPLVRLFFLAPSEEG